MKIYKADSLSQLIEIASNIKENIYQYKGRGTHVRQGIANGKRKKPYVIKVFRTIV